MDRLTLKRNKTKIKNVFKGSIQLFVKDNGTIKYKTKGDLKKKHITQITQLGDLFRIDFIDEFVPYTTKVKVGKEFSLITTVNSDAFTLGDGTGAEVIFGPGDPVIPSFLDGAPIPEPAALLLLTAGALLTLPRRRRHKN